jgi:hypothetical protein
MQYPDYLETKTAQEQGFKLPIGEVVDGKLVKDFALGDITPDVEKSVGLFREQNSDLPATIIPSKLVSMILTSVGGKPFGKKKDGKDMSEEERHYAVRAMPSPDVYYMYIKARIRELGSDYVIPYACAHCGFKAEKMTCDLSTMEVTSVVDVRGLRHEVDLRVGFNYRDSAFKKKVYLQHLPWFYMEKQEMGEIGGNEILFNLFMLEHSICGVEGAEASGMLEPEEFQTIRKIDRELIAGKIHEMDCGPRLVVSGNCPGTKNGKPCRESYVYPVNWDYDHFFSISSLS